MVWAERLQQEFHVDLVECAVPFAVVAANTGADEVLPCVRSPSGFRNDVIDCQRWCALVAVGTAEVVATEDILSRQFHFLVRQLDIDREPYDAWIGIAVADGVDESVRTCRNHLCLAEPEEHDRLLDVANAQRLIVLVQDQYLAAERRRSGCDDTII